MAVVSLQQLSSDDSKLPQMASNGVVHSTFVANQAYLCALLAMLCAYSLYALFMGRQRRSLGSCKSKAVLITGCDSGIGRAVAKNLYDTTKFSLILTFVKPPSAAESEAGARGSDGYEEFRQLAAQDNSNNRLHLLSLDLTNDESIKAVADYVTNTRTNSLNAADSSKCFTNLWALVNNAGVLFFGEFDWLTIKQIETMYAVNVLGPMKLTKALLPLIIACRGSRIINVSSVGDKSIYPGLSVYDSTKAAVSLFTQNLRLELEKFHCHTVTFRPSIYSSMTAIFNQNKLASQPMWQAMSDDQRRMYGKYFDWWFNERTLSKAKNTHSVNSWDSSPMFPDMKTALMSKVPPLEIICAPPLFFALFWLQDLATSNIRYFFARLVMRKVDMRSRSLMDTNFVKAYQAHSLLKEKQ